MERDHAILDVPQSASKEVTVRVRFVRVECGKDPKDTDRTLFVWTVRFARTARFAHPMVYLLVDPNAGQVMINGRSDRASPTRNRPPAVLPDPPALPGPQGGLVAQRRHVVDGGAGGSFCAALAAVAVAWLRRRAAAVR